MQGVLLDSELRLEITPMKIKLFADFVKMHAAHSTISKNEK